MTLRADGWYDWAIPLPIPGIDKTLAQGGKLISRQPTPVEWQTFHSQEGYVQLSSRVRAMCADWVHLNASDRALVIRALYDSHWEWKNPLRPTTAWHGTNLRNCGADGALVQHAPDFARLAHGHASNPHGPGWEAEGVFSQPLDAGQEAVVRRILRDAEKRHGRQYSRADLTIREHRNSGPTACPSERYTALWAEMEGGGEMTPEERAMLDELWRRTGGDEGRDYDLLAGLRNQQNALTGHIDQHPGGDAGVEVPEHSHYNHERTLGVVRNPARNGGN